jgi:hypothetical protein
LTYSFLIFDEDLKSSADLQPIMSRDSDDTLGHGRETRNTEDEAKERAKDSGEKGEKISEEQGPVGFWHS